MALAQCRYRRPGRYRLLLVGCLLAAIAGRPVLAPAAPVPENPPADSTPAVTYPGIEQLVPLSTLLGIEASDAKSRIGKAGEVSQVVAQIDENQQLLLTLDQNLAGWGPVSQWSEGRLLSALQRLSSAQNRQKALLEKLAPPFKAIEELHQAWTKKRDFWSGWQLALKQERVKVPAEQFARNRLLIEQVIGRAITAMAALTEIQQKLSAQQGIVGDWQIQINGALDKLHGPLLERNAPPLLSREFFDQFNRNLWVGLRDDLGSTTQVPIEFALRQGGVAILQLIAILVIAWQLYQRARAPEPVSEKWRFLFRHPLAGALFIGLIAGTFFYTSPPPLWRWVQIVFGTIAATILICAMLERPRLRRLIIILAMLNVCSTTIQLVGLVQPLHRLFLVAVCLIATPLCLAAARRQQVRTEGRLDLLAVAFYVGTTAGCIGLVAQLFGYADLTAYLVNALLGTTFIYLFARMALHLGKGAIATLLETEAVSKRRLMRRLGPETGPRLNTLLHVIVIAYALLYLLARWRIYASPDKAWDGIMALTFKVGELQISLGVVLMAIAVLYLSLIVSWIIQALLDAEIMSRQGMEHGVKVAVKTLVHYSLILLGFLLAISVAGIDMSKFAILAGALGVGIGFGLQNIVNNFISGLILLFERPVKVGDTVSIDTQWGTITKIGLRSTVVETLDRAELIVPNSELVSQKVTNWTFTSGVSRVVLTVGVAYGTPLENVLDILLRVAREHAEVMDEPPPSAIFTGFGDSSINFELRAWIGDINHRLKIRSELGLAIDKSFRAAGVVIPFPQRDLHLQSIAPNLRGIVPDTAAGAAESTKDSAE